MPESTRPPLLPLYDSRSGYGDIDAKLTNGFIEKDQGNGVWVNKRPGLVIYIVDAGASGIGLGCYYWTTRDSIIAITNDGKVRESFTTTVSSAANISGVYDFNQTMGTPSFLFFKNAAAAYTYSSAGVFAQVVDVNYPAATVPGSAYLDGTMYVMDQKGNIWGSKFLNNVTTWDALNVIIPQIEPDPPTALAKQLIYIVAFMRWTIEFFYDAANPVGTPLLPVQNAKLSMGCKDAQSIQMIADELFFVGSNRLPSSGGVFVISGLKLKTISTPAVDKFIAANGGGSNSWQSRRGGHTYYGLSYGTVSLVYDVTEGLWYFWKEANAALSIVASATNTRINQEYLQESTGNTFRYFADAGFGFATDSSTPGVTTTIAVDIVTPNFDGGTRAKKFLAKLRIIADQNSSGALKICWSDDDYKTWSPWQTVNLQEDSPQLTQLGTFRKRAFWFRHESPTAFRMAPAEMELLAGDC